MAPHKRMTSSLWPYLFIVPYVFASVCSAREMQGFRSFLTSHTKFAKEHRSLDLTLKKWSGTDEFGKSSENRMGSSGNDIYVSKTGKANFNSIQAAINSVPEYNEQWAQIDIAAGVYQ